MHNELYHHGILGMRWGIRRYQPYSTTGPRKGGKTGKEIGEAARAGSEKQIIAPSVSDKKRKAKIVDVRKQQAKKEAAELKAKKKEERKAYKIHKKEVRAEKERVREEKREFKSREEFENEKKKVLNSGNPAEILKFNDEHRHMISNQELQIAIDRIGKEQTLKSMLPKAKTGQQKIDDLTKKINTGINFANTSINAYNTSARVINTFSDKDNKLPYIEGVGSKKEEKKK